MEAAHLLLDLLDDGVCLQVIDGRLRAEFPPGMRTPGRADAIRTKRDGLFDLASRSPAEILVTLRLAGIIVSLEGDRIRVEGDLSALTPQHRALLRFHRDDLVDELHRELSDGAMVVGRVWTISDRILAFGPAELNGYRRELEHGPADDPATPEEWAALARAQRMQAGSRDRYVEGE
jgi:hypothetical protein